MAYEFGKKDFILHSTYDPTISRKGSMLRRGLAYRYFVFGCLNFGQIYVMLILGHLSFA